MKHIFSSGEEIYHKNEKQLDQGILIIKNIDYELIKDDTVFIAEGFIDDKPVSVEFRIEASSFDDIRFRNSVKILMQSDLVQVKWEYYKITYL